MNQYFHTSTTLPCLHLFHLFFPRVASRSRRVPNSRWVASVSDGAPSLLNSNAHWAGGRISAHLSSCRSAGSAPVGGGAGRRGQLERNVRVIFVRAPARSFSITAQLARRLRGSGGLEAAVPLKMGGKGNKGDKERGTKKKGK